MTNRHGIENGRVIIQQDFDNLEAELQKAHARIAKLQRKQMGNNNKIALARFRIANLEQIIICMKGPSNTRLDSYVIAFNIARMCGGIVLKAYVRRFQELATLCPTMVPDYEKMMEVFIEGLPQSIEGNVTSSKPQTLEEAN
ncbi:hypothetical protein Tco_1285636 [Tanacetum coccineum]